MRQAIQHRNHLPTRTSGFSSPETATLRLQEGHLVRGEPIQGGQRVRG